ncbi:MULTISPECIES: hypothetical protein [Sanguibacteroides]|uniref:hypothetical protein n=1 Tax=Sanguibacteroides TaxID=1635148 RepID=UPI001F1C6F86|nr:MULTISPECIES: hypothetical protein [Sanguibacteroides]
MEDTSKIIRSLVTQAAYISPASQAALADILVRFELDKEEVFYGKERYVCITAWLRKG